VDIEEQVEGSHHAKSGRLASLGMGPSVTRLSTRIDTTMQCFSEYPCRKNAHEFVIFNDGLMRKHLSR
jgi:hypothetical protein